MTARALLGRLDGVRATGRGRWIARCPAHDDRRASLSVRELDDGRVLVHDFAGCGLDAVLSSTGLDIAALYPPRPIDHARRERMPYSPIDVLRAVAYEVLIAAVAASNLGRGIALTDADRARLTTAAARLQRAVELCDGD